MLGINETARNDFKREIIKYLESKGKIKAELLSKIEKRFCALNSKYKVKKREFLDSLISMMIKHLIEILIVVPSRITWEKHHFSDFEYLEQNDYIIRRVSKSGSVIIKPNADLDYFFNSIGINFDNEEKLNSLVEKLKIDINTIPDIKYHTIIFYPIGSDKINLFEPLEQDYVVNICSLNSPKKHEIYDKIKFPIEEQLSSINLIQSYRINYMCFYITLIENIQYCIKELQENVNGYNNQYNEINEFIRKFAYYCISYVKSDWVYIKDPNPYRWETFFKFFEIPIKIFSLKFLSINFYGKMFECSTNFKFGIFVKKEFKEDIKSLKNYGFQELHGEDNEIYDCVGLDLKINLPCPTIEHFYFLYKYICYYYQFLLFFHAFRYVKKIRPQIQFSDNESRLYVNFLPVMKQLFNIDEMKIQKVINFKYITINPDELELIYNKFLFSNIKSIEKRLSSYFLLRCSRGF